MHHVRRGLPLGMAVSLGQIALNNQPVPVHHHRLRRAKGESCSRIVVEAEVSYPSGLTGVDLFCCPAPRHEVVQTVHLVVCDAGEDPAQPGFRIDLVHAAGFDERVGDGSGIAAAF